MYGHIYKIKHMAREKTNENICITLFKKIESNALKRNLNFELTVEDMWDTFIQQGEKCAITGVNINMLNASINKNYHLQTASLDRKDSSKGYIKGNVQWVHKVINSLKSDFTDDEFISLCHLVATTNSSYNPIDITNIRAVKKRITKETILRMKRSNPHKKPITQLDLEGNIIKHWDSINEARDFYNYKSEMGIIGTCKGRQNSSGGYIWKYKE